MLCTADSWVQRVGRVGMGRRGAGGVEVEEGEELVVGMVQWMGEGLVILRERRVRLMPS